MEGIESLAEELADRFGSLPPEIKNLFYQLRVRILANKAGVEAISMENKQILLQLPQERTSLDIPSLGKDVRLSKRGIWLTQTGDTDWTSRLIELLNTLSEHKTQR
jgi:transcription-repair coupling factor (superfamily II helicase)